MIRTPIYYTGKKEKLLTQILPHFPNSCNTFFDIFSGSCSVGINYGENCKEVIFVDQCIQLQSVISYLKVVPKDIIRNVLYKIIEENDGLNTKEKYIKYRDSIKYTYTPADLILLTCVCFNCQMRFNSKGGFNAPYGNRFLVDNMLEKIQEFCEELQKEKYHILLSDYSSILDYIISRKEGCFVYLDPPYYGSVATYNTGWDKQKEDDLFFFIKELNTNGIKFCMSNNKNYNTELKRYESMFNIIDLDYNYNSCSYHKKDRNQSTGEILITNY